MFIAYELSLEVIRGLRDVVPRIRKHNADLANQIVRAASSVTLNLNEGRKRFGGDRTNHYRYASGSASEVLAALDTADAWGWLTDSREVREKLDHLLAILWKLTSASAPTAAVAAG